MPKVTRNETQIFARIIFEEVTAADFGDIPIESLAAHFSGKEDEAIEPVLRRIIDRLSEVADAPGGEAGDVENAEAKKLFTIENLFPGAVRLQDGPKEKESDWK